MRFQLPVLPFDINALEPHISAETIATHYGRHHRAYIQKTNELLDAPTAWQDELSLEEIVKTSSGHLFNNAAQAWNHAFFWNCLAPEAGGEPPRELDEALAKNFGSFEQFRRLFTKHALDVFGSGWVWLVMERTGRLNVLTTANADTPIVGDDVPLLVLDVWEHAYYLDYRHERAKFVEAFWKLVNWDFVLENLRREEAPNLTKSMAVATPARSDEVERPKSQPNL